MRWQKRFIAAILAAAASISSAAADDQHGWYVGLEGGWVKVHNTELPALGYTDIQFDQDLGPDAYAILGTAGYAFERNWRLELELGYRHNGLDQIEVSIGDNAGLGPVAVDGGRLREFTGFVNAVYDLPLSRRWALSLGAGIGFDNVSLDIPDTDGAGLLLPISVDNTVLAGQALAGLTYHLAAHWDLVLNYRYLKAADVTLTGEVCDAGFAIARVVVPAVTCVPEDDSLAMTKHTITIGFRYGFDTPEEAPPVVVPPVVVPPAVKQFIIFFGFNKCNITAEADAVLSEAASAAKSSGAASVLIVGHTDTMGSNSYNEKLSDCRANAAKSGLIAKGVAAGSISATGKGESDLMVQTGDGTKEPQNRRTTVEVE